ncbi:chitinase-like protein Idgf1, partial [Musca vetustissima]|uniref:chitinase-like protein Idgf1 n=1 Tax=Musca vetustissima TaxID=27455 RepID=UPI002AB6DAA1
MDWFYITAFISLLANPLWAAQNFKVVCFFDSANTLNLTLKDLGNAIGDCSHFIYGYATLVPYFFPISFDGTVGQTVLYSDIIQLKNQFPQVKFLLSVGGDRDRTDGEKYLHLLETTIENQQNFIKSIVKFVQGYKFDGIDLAYQFPKERSEQQQYKQPFSKLIQSLGTELAANNLMLTLSVLPNVNASWYLDIPSIEPHLDFINLWAFDFENPKRSPHKADYSAPLWSPPPAGSRPAWNNANAVVQYWKSQNISNEKIILGIPVHGVGWKMSSQSWDNNGNPIVYHMEGPSKMTDKFGHLKWPEFCKMVQNQTIHVRGSYDYGRYFIYPKIKDHQHDSWISFDGPNIAQYKSLFARTEKIGGVAAIDISSDDYLGKCTGLKFPILKYL